MGLRAEGNESASVLQLFIFHEGRFFGTECFVQPVVVVGRSPDVDLQLDDDSISRHHARFTVTSNGILLEDMGSSNGTLVNGTVIDKCAVDSRHEVSIGAFTLKLKVLSKKAASDQALGKATNRVKKRGPEEQGEEGDVEKTEVVDTEIDFDTEICDGPDLGFAPREVQRTTGVIPSTSAGLGIRVETASTRMPAGRVASSRNVARGGRIDKIAEALEEEIGSSDDGAPAGEKRREPSERKAQAAGKVGRKESAPAALIEQDTMGIGIKARGGRNARASEQGAPAERVLSGSYRALAEDDDEDGDEEQNFLEPFSLLNNLVRETFQQPAFQTEPRLILEVIGYGENKRLGEYAQVASGTKNTRAEIQGLVIDHRGDGNCELQLSENIVGGAVLGGRTVEIDKLRDDSGGGGFTALTLNSGDCANLTTREGDDGWFLRFAHPPMLPPGKSIEMDPWTFKGLGVAAFLHVAVMFFIAAFSSLGMDTRVSGMEKEFVKVDLKDLEIEKKEEEAEIPLDQMKPPKQEEAPVEVKEEKPREKPKKAPPTRRKVARQSSASPDEGDGGPGILSALGNLNQKKSATNIVAAVTNLDAVRVPGGKARYKVSGLVTKLPTSGVVISTGQGVGVKGGIELLAGGKGKAGGPGVLIGGQTGRRGVGGVVLKAPKHTIKVRGSLSREAIAAVVQQHLKEIQYCYEKNLMLNSKLAGKVIMEWEIAVSGSVTSIKTQMNTMQTAAVATCVGNLIRTWKFPKPQGGTVEVSYPFNFSPVGF